MVGLRARNRLLILAAGAGSFAVFPPPHKFFFARENEVNLGFVYYRKDDDHSFSLGTYGRKEEKAIIPGARATRSGREELAYPGQNGTTIALYNAPAGTLQRMAVYYYLSTKSAVPTQEAVLAYTHDDVFKPLPGFKVMAGHFHMDFNEQLRDRGTMDYQPPWWVSSVPWESTFFTWAISTTILIRMIPGQSVSRKRRSTLRVLSASLTETFWSCPRKSRTRISAAIGG